MQTWTVIKSGTQYSITIETLRPETLFDLIASSKAKGHLFQEPNNVSRISYSPYLLIFEQIEQIGCVIKLCRKFLGMCQTIGCAQFLKLVSAAQGGGGHLLVGESKLSVALDHDSSCYWHSGTASFGGSGCESYAISLNARSSYVNMAGSA